MQRPRIAVVMDVDVKTVFDEQKGIAKDSTYANYILREFFTEKGLLPRSELT